MKSLKSTVTIMAIVILTFITGTTFAQVTASATATATIVTPIGITKTVDMNFGNLSVSTSSGTVLLATDNSRTEGGGVTLPATAGTVAAAQFTVTGEGVYTYSITLPSTDYIITHSAGAGTGIMEVNTFTSLPDATGTLSGGTQTLIVGATLNVDGSEAAGVYTNATGFDVTVNYN